VKEGGDQKEGKEAVLVLMNERQGNGIAPWRGKNQRSRSRIWGKAGKLNVLAPWGGGTILRRGARWQFSWSGSKTKISEIKLIKEGRGT